MGFAVNEGGCVVPSRSRVELGAPVSRWLVRGVVGIGLVVVILMTVYRADPPRAFVEPGSSDGPTYFVQILRPALGLPLGGVVPPGLFGVDTALGFDGSRSDASIQWRGDASREAGQLVMTATDWDVVVEIDQDGRIDLAETEAIFSFTFEERRVRVRCWPTEQAKGRCELVWLEGGRELGGMFEVELENCSDLETGLSLWWPPSPLVLRGSFDRIPTASP